MESQTKSFHLATPFPHPNKSSNLISTSKRPVVGNASTVKRSNCTASELTFSDVLEYNKHLVALRDLEALKNQYYEEYIDNLESKVLKQRRNLKNEATPKVTTGRQVGTQGINKLKYHRLRHDAEYLRKVPKSRYYHLLAARDMMLAKGLIKNRSQEDLFWEQVVHDSDLWSKPLPLDVPSDIMSRMMIDRFSRRNNQISTHKSKERKVTFNESPDYYSVPSKDDSKPAVLDPNLLKFKINLKRPKLHSMKQLSPLPPIEPQCNEIPDSTARCKRFRKFRSVQHSYDVAMVHLAAATQMIKSHGLSLDDPEKFLQGEVMVKNQENTQIQSSKSRAKLPLTFLERNEQAFITEPVYGHDEVLIPDLEYKYSTVLKHRKRVKDKQKKLTISDQSDHNPFDQERIDQSTDVTPLDYGMMLTQGNLKVKKSTCLSSFWTNYITTSGEYQD